MQLKSPISSSTKTGTPATVGTIAVLNGTGRTNQSRPDAAVSNDGSFVVTWEHENADALQAYNSTEIKARRFTVQAYLPEAGEGGYDPDYVCNFFDNGAEGGKVGYQPPATAYNTDFVSDPYALNANSTTKVQCVYPVAEEFVVNASLNGKQTDPAISADNNGNFIITWTYIAQDNSYFGGIYGRQFNNEAQPTSRYHLREHSPLPLFYPHTSQQSRLRSCYVELWPLFLSIRPRAVQRRFIIDGQRRHGGNLRPSVSFDYTPLRFGVHSRAAGAVAERPCCLLPIPT